LENIIKKEVTITLKNGIQKTVIDEISKNIKLDDYVKDISRTFKTSKVTLLHFSRESIAIRPSEIAMVDVKDIYEQPEIMKKD